MNGFGWPYRGFGDGLQFAPHSPDLGDGYFVWRPGGEPEPLGLDLSPQTGFYEEWGGLVAEVSRGSEIYLVDIVTGQITTTLPFDPGEGLVGGVCFSPDGTYLAAVTSAGPGEIFRVSTGDPVGSFTTSDPNWGIGWTSDSQLAFIEETPSGSRLSLFDTGTSTTIGIAELGAPGFWGVATSGPVC